MLCFVLQDILQLSPAERPVQQAKSSRVDAMQILQITIFGVPSSGVLSSKPVNLSDTPVTNYPQFLVKQNIAIENDHFE